MLPRFAHGLRRGKCARPRWTGRRSTPRPASSSWRLTRFISSPPNRPNASPGQTDPAHRRRLQLFLLRRRAATKFPSPAPRSFTIRRPQTLVEETARRARACARICSRPSARRGTRLGPMKKNLATETGLPQIEVIAVLLARHRRGRCRRARQRRELGLLEFRHLVAHGRRMAQARHQRTGPLARVHQRNRFRRYRPPPQKHRRPLDRPGMPPALGEGREEIRFCQARKTRRRRAAVRLAHQSRRPAFFKPGRHAEKDRRVLPRKPASPCPPTTAPTCAAFTKASPCFTASSCAGWNGSPARKSSGCTSSAAAARTCTLNQFAANALKIPVIAGPTECAALGNILVQAIALGHLPSLAAAREVVRNSFELKTVTPQDSAQWDAAAARFEKLLS